MDKQKLREYFLSCRETEFPNKRLTTPKEIYDFVSKFYESDINIYESFFLVPMSRNLSTLGYVKISQGGIHGTVVDVTLIMRYAIEFLASSIILVHNHPSGNLNPSSQDIDITKKIVNACSIFGITVLDHLIITEKGFYSFSDEGLL